MSIELTILGNTYEYPSAGQDPNWSGDATDWAEAVTDVINSLLGAGDILKASTTIDNNISSTIISGMIFNPITIRAANINYSIYRESNSTTSGYSETGTIYLTYDTAAAPGSRWLLGQNSIGTSGVIFSVTDLGQVYYTSNDIGAAGYSGVIKFSARTLLI